MIRTAIFLTLLTAYVNSKNPHVQIQQGFVRGRYLQTAKGRIFSSFTGIPYAEPPVGPLRFEAPLPARSWSGFRNATELHPICPQTNIFNSDSNVRGNEDCLYLNVYTPQVADYDMRLLPVMIFLHGGAFFTGSGNYDLYGPEILLDKDIVLVVPNYRLGPLGFLSTGDEVVPGNNGLKDQNLAIKWVNANVIQFGGDPNSITLFGLSAGGTSAHFHMLSPLSKDLIKGVISHSGTAMSPAAIAPHGQAERNFKRLAQSVNCLAEINRETVDCLKNVDAYELTRQQDNLYAWSWHPLTPFRPVVEPNVEGAFLPDYPENIIKSGQAANIPFMTGITTEDGIAASADIFGDPPLLQQFIKYFKVLLPYTIPYDETAPDKDSVTKKIIDFYFGHRKIDISSRTEVTDIFTDGQFLLPANEALIFHLKYTRAPVYNYAFGYRGSVSYSSIYGDSSYNYGVSHTDDLLYLFTHARLFPNYTASYNDRAMSEILTTLWTNFAATGNPTPTATTLIPGRWERVSSKNLEYLLIRDAAELKMDKRLYSDRAELWEHLPLHSIH